MWLQARLLCAETALSGSTRMHSNAFATLGLLMWTASDGCSSCSCRLQLWCRHLLLPPLRVCELYCRVCHAMLLAACHVACCALLTLQLPVGGSCICVVQTCIQDLGVLQHGCWQTCLLTPLRQHHPCLCACASGLQAGNMPACLYVYLSVCVCLLAKDVMLCVLLQLFVLEEENLSRMQSVIFVLARTSSKHNHQCTLAWRRRWLGLCCHLCLC